ncbi:hypothetical protein [Saccharibacter sp. EH611]|uniref:hypothetical protein n=1 Tax=Saccharibacter sp. EH611 TaxID=2689391 RepID=UPI001F1E62B3|nr:hypothetical protein [Saccharibacter sp. EH611]
MTLHSSPEEKFRIGAHYYRHPQQAHDLDRAIFLITQLADAGFVGGQALRWLHKACDGQYLEACKEIPDIEAGLASY